MPQSPDPYELHEAALAKLREQAAEEKAPAPPKNARAARRSRDERARTERGQVERGKVERKRPEPRQSERDRRERSRPERIRPERGRRRVENRAEGPEGATNVFGAATGAIYDLGALILSIGWFAVKWTLLLGTKLVVGMSKAAHWVINEVTGGG